MNIDIKELLDDDALDPEKLFNEEEYSTLIIKREGFSKKENNAADLLESLLDKNITREESETIFLKLKEYKARQLMVDSIKKAGRVEEKTILTAACWECGLDFTNDFLFFVELVLHDNFLLALEALTVVENCEGTIDEATLRKALEMAENSKSKKTSAATGFQEEKQKLIDAMIENLKSRLAE